MPDQQRFIDLLPLVLGGKTILKNGGSFYQYVAHLARTTEKSSIQQDLRALMYYNPVVATMHWKQFYPLQKYHRPKIYSNSITTSPYMCKYKIDFHLFNLFIWLFPRCFSLHCSFWREWHTVSSRAHSLGFAVRGADGRHRHAQFSRPTSRGR